MIQLKKLNNQKGLSELVNKNELSVEIMMNKTKKLNDELIKEITLAVMVMFIVASTFYSCSLLQKEMVSSLFDLIGSNDVGFFSIIKENFVRFFSSFLLYIISFPVFSLLIVKYVLELFSVTSKRKLSNFDLPFMAFFYLMFSVIRMIVFPIVTFLTHLWLGLLALYNFIRSRFYYRNGLKENLEKLRRGLSSRMKK